MDSEDVSSVVAGLVRTVIDRAVQQATEEHCVGEETEVVEDAVERVEEDAADPPWLEEASKSVSHVEHDVTILRSPSGDVVLQLHGRIPPVQLQFLAQQNAALLTVEDRRMAVYRVGSRIHIGGVVVRKESYNGGVYETVQGTPVATTTTVLPRRSGAVAQQHRERKKAFERR